MSYLKGKNDRKNFFINNFFFFEVLKPPLLMQNSKNDRTSQIIFMTICFPLKCKTSFVEDRSTVADILENASRKNGGSASDSRSFVADTRSKTFLCHKCKNSVRNVGPDLKCTICGDTFLEEKEDVSLNRTSVREEFILALFPFVFLLRYALLEITLTPTP